MLNRVILVTFIALSASIVNAQVPNWTNLSGPYGGRVIDIIGGDSGAVYVLGYDQINKLDSATNSWRQLIYSLYWNGPALGMIIQHHTIAFVKNDNSVSLGVSNDDGLTWEVTGTTLEQDMTCSGFRVEDTIYVGTKTNGVVRTQKGYVYLWEKVDTSHWPVYSLIRDDQGTVYAGSNGAVHVSTDLGTTWTSLSKGLPPQNITAVYSHQGMILAGTKEMGVYQWNPSLGQWIPMNANAEPWSISSFAFWNGAPYLSSIDAGVFRYDNQSQSWKKSSTGLPNGWVRKLFVRTGGQLLAGTDHGVYAMDIGKSTWQPIGMPVNNIHAMMETPKHSLIVHCTEGLFRSPDNGRTWTNITVGGEFFPTLSIAPSDNGTLVALTIYGLYHSRDSGSTWTPSTAGLEPVDGTWQDAIIPPSLIWVGSHTYIAQGTHRFISTNDGVSWNPLNGTYLWRLAGSGSVLFGTVNNLIYRSTNGGINWDSVFDVKSNVRGFAVRGNEVRVSTSYTGTYYTSNAGSSWTQIEPPGDFVYNLFVAPDHIYAATSNGLKSSATMGGVMTTIAFSGKQVIQAAASGDHLVVYLRNERPLVSPDLGVTWKPVEGMYDSVVSICVDKDGVIYANTKDGVYRSFDRGEHFMQPSKLPLSNDVGNFIGIQTDPVCAAPNGDLFFVNPYGTLYRSSDEGTHWLRLDTTAGAGSVYLFAAGPNGDLYRTSRNDINTLLISKDNGINWNPCTTLNHIFMIAFDSSGGILASVNDSTSNNRSYFYYSSDHAVTWARLDSVPPMDRPGLAAIDRFGEIYIANLDHFGKQGVSATGDKRKFLTTNTLVNNSIVSLAADKYGYAYAGARDNSDASHGNIYRSTDAGKTWSNFGGNGFLSESVSVILPTDSFIYVGMGGGGILRTPLEGNFRQSGVPSKENDLPDLLIWPNPASEVVHVSCGKGEGQDLEIYNELGEHISLQRNGKKGAYDLSRITSGVYSVHIQGTTAKPQILIIRH